MNFGSGGYQVGPEINLNTGITQSGDYTLLLAQYNGSGITSPSQPTPMWTLDLNGTIYQHVEGDVTSNEWYNTGYPLW
ncbi:hypothetical protein QTN47_15495 [Danxiaibacter flavus]|uniref:Uncharacterized protein n=1 Tax=Danxiaibacter flavus TaxID=3049108 RepID=A0ABV3ZGD7_9BACT|nr:hypothetical protein QNM32_15505 [Chitinophagaceae bacterium DXS]